MRVERLLSVNDVREAARRRLPRAVFEFIDGGAEDEVTLRENRLAFERRRIVRRVLTDVSSPDLRTDLLGTACAAPLVVAPMGSCTLAWPEADIAIARAAARHGIPYVLSTMSTTGMERLARAVDGSLWFQLYVLKEHSANEALIARAKASGYTALVVTMDLQAGGKRERDLRNGISIPMRFGWRQLWDGLTHPSWSLRAMTAGLPEFENVSGLLSEGRAGLTIAARVGKSLDAAFDWDGFARLRDLWQGPMWVKGVEHPEDAARLVQCGANGIWVSNHGGRQLDGAIASADALPMVSAALHGKVPIIVDSGIRRGVDILKARALGASAAAVGRPAIFGAAAAGERGAARVLEILVDELRLASQLSGVPSMATVDHSLLAP